MIEVSDDEPEPQVRQVTENVQKCDGIRASRNTDNDSVPRP
jgi:hypothetical protein